MTTSPRSLLALMAAMDLPDGADVPEWVHLLPGDASIRTYDGRGPYRVADAAALISASMAEPRGLLIDENHSTDKIGTQGGQAPARGWIKELQARADGIWGRIEWNRSGRGLLADRAYRGISPVFRHTEGGEVLQILRASLTNVPNIKNLTALNMESPVTLSALLARMAEKLGLPATATEDDILAALAALAAKADTAMQSSMAALGTALGVDAGNGAAMLAAVQALQAAQATSLTQATRIAALENAQKQVSAEGWMAGQIAAKRGIPADKRAGLIALHMQDVAQAEAVAKLYPDLGPATAMGAAPEAGAVLTALNAEQAAAADALGVDRAAYLKTLQTEQEKR